MAPWRYCSEDMTSRLRCHWNFALVCTLLQDHLGAVKNTFQKRFSKQLGNHARGALGAVVLHRLKVRRSS